MPLENKKIRKAIVYAVFFTFLAGVGVVIWGAATGRVAQISVIASLVFALSAVEFVIYVLFILFSSLYTLFQRWKAPAGKKQE